MLSRIAVLVIALFLFPGCYPERMYRPPLITDHMKRNIAFIYAHYFDRQTKAIRQNVGTGFFVGLKESGSKHNLYFVTCKHVFERPKECKDCVPLNMMNWHIHDAKGDLYTPPMPLIKEGESKNIYFHNDVDIAVLSLVPETKTWNYNFVPEHLIMTKQEFLGERVQVGTEVFFLGWSRVPMGKRQNHPIARFGKITQLDKDAFEESKALLIETTAFGGNSGSPVFAYFGGRKVEGTLNTYVPEYKLIGILQAYLPEEVKMNGIANVESGVTAYENSGISIVVPSYLLLEMLHSEEFVKERTVRPKRMIIEYPIPKK